MREQIEKLRLTCDFCLKVEEVSFNDGYPRGWTELYFDYVTFSMAVCDECNKEHPKTIALFSNFARSFSYAIAKNLKRGEG